MSLIDGELFRKKFFALDIEFRPSQIDAVFDCLGDSEIVESSVSCENTCEITRKTNASGDLISRAETIKAIEQKSYRHTYLWQIIDIVNGVPSAEPQIIRCKDCKHLIDHRCYHWRSLSDWRNDNDYCSRAERREG